MYYSHVFYSNAKTSYHITYTPDIVYAKRPGRDLKLQLLSPVPPALQEPPRRTYMTVLQEQGRVPRPTAPAAPKERPRFPLIVDVPGSGWAGAEGIKRVPQMVRLAEEGYIIASIDYRGVYQDNCEQYLADVMRMTPTAANVLEYAAIVRDRALLRRMPERGGMTGAARYFVTV